MSGVAQPMAGAKHAAKETRGPHRGTSETPGTTARRVMVDASTQTVTTADAATQTEIKPTLETDDMLSEGGAQEGTTRDGQSGADMPRTPEPKRRRVAGESEKEAAAVAVQADGEQQDEHDTSVECQGREPILTTNQGSTMATPTTDEHACSSPGAEDEQRYENTEHKRRRIAGVDGSDAVVAKLEEGEGQQHELDTMVEGAGDTSGASEIEQPTQPTSSSRRQEKKKRNKHNRKMKRQQATAPIEEERRECGQTTVSEDISEHISTTTTSELSASAVVTLQSLKRAYPDMPWWLIGRLSIVCNAWVLEYENVLFSPPRYESVDEELEPILPPPTGAPEDWFFSISEADFDLNADDYFKLEPHAQKHKEWLERQMIAAGMVDSVIREKPAWFENFDL